MTNFEDQYFQKFKFDPLQLKRFLGSAKRDLHIAKESKVPEVVFKFSYEALIKLGIFCVAREGYRTRSAPGHHVKILEKMASILNDEDVAILGNRMRQTRNLDLYEAGAEISEKDSREYMSFVSTTAEKVKKHLFRNS